TMGRALFLRSWLGLYLLMLFLSLSDRLGLFGWRVPESKGVLAVNVLAIVVTAVTWLWFEKQRRFGVLLLRILSSFRILATTAATSIFFAFILAYIPTGAIPWQLIIRLPTPLYLSICVLILVLEIFFFIQLGRVSTNSR